MLPEDLPGFIADCLRQLQEPEPARRMEAASCLGRLRREGRAAAPLLIKHLHDLESAVRKMVALALGDIGSSEAVPALRKALYDADDGVRRRAAIALEEIIGIARAA